MKENNSVCNNIQRTKYLGISLTNGVEAMNTENCKPH